MSSRIHPLIAHCTSRPEVLDQEQDLDRTFSGSEVNDLAKWTKHLERVLSAAMYQGLAHMAEIEKR